MKTRQAYSFLFEWHNPSIISALFTSLSRMKFGNTDNIEVI